MKYSAAVFHWMKTATLCPRFSYFVSIIFLYKKSVSLTDNYRYRYLSSQHVIGLRFFFRRIFVEVSYFERKKPDRRKENRSCCCRLMNVFFFWIRGTKYVSEDFFSICMSRSLQSLDIDKQEKYRHLHSLLGFFFHQNRKYFLSGMIKLNNVYLCIILW